MTYVPPYKKLKTYQQADLIYELTKQFTKQHLDQFKDRRLISQMDDAGRSGVRNIAEGGKRKGLKDYIEFLSFARSSLEELLEDYRALAKEKKVLIWDKDDVRLRRLRWWRRIDLDSLPSSPSLPSELELAINLLIDLIISTNFLLDKQIASLEEKFVKEGGYSENLAAKRRNYRGY